MATGLIVALVLAVPIMLIPAALVWYINVSGIYLALKEARERRAVQGQATEKVKA